MRQAGSVACAHLHLASCSAAAVLWRAGKVRVRGQLSSLSLPRLQQHAQQQALPQQQALLEQHAQQQALQHCQSDFGEALCSSPGSLHPLAPRRG